MLTAYFVRPAALKGVKIVRRHNYYFIDLNKGARCSCTGHAMTGKTCAHLQAVQIFMRGAGRPEQWHRESSPISASSTADGLGFCIEIEAEAARKGPPSSKKSMGRMRPDEVERTELRSAIRMINRRADTTARRTREVPPLDYRNNSKLAQKRREEDSDSEPGKSPRRVASSKT